MGLRGLPAFGSAGECRAPAVKSWAEPDSRRRDRKLTLRHGKGIIALGAVETTRAEEAKGREVPTDGVTSDPRAGLYDDANGDIGARET